MSEPVKVLLLMRLYANEYIFFQICFILLQQVRKSSSCSLFLFSAFFKGDPIVVLRIRKDARTTCSRKAFRTMVAPRKRGKAQRSTFFKQLVQA